MPYDPSTLIPAYKEKVEELLAKDEQFRNIVEKQVSNFRSMGTSFTNGITLKEGIAGVVAGKPRLYDLNESPYFKKNREKYKVLNIMHKAVTKLPLNILIKSSKKSAKNKSARENKPTSPGFSYTNPKRQAELELVTSKLADMPEDTRANLAEARRYTVQAYQEAHKEIYGSAKKQGLLRKKRKGKKSKSSKKSKASKKSKSSKKTRRRTRRRRY